MIYLLKVNILLAVFYGFYRLLFVRDTFFGWRRAVLLLMMVAAVVLPAIDLSWWVQSHPSAVNLSEVYREVLLPTVTITGTEHRFPWLRLFTLLYIIGVAALAFRLFWQLTTIVRMGWGGGSVIRLHGSSCPFSFFRWIFVNPEAQTKEQLEEIMIHEMAHVRQWHSVDVVLMELLTIVCWVNPFAWLMRREVRLNLEYLADERVVAAGSERKAYQYHLLGLAYGKNVATITNNFNVLPLKLRIKMMNKKRTNSWLRAKYLLLAPIVGMALVGCNMGSSPKAADEAEASKPDTVSVVVTDKQPSVTDGTTANATDVTGQDEAQAMENLKDELMRQGLKPVDEPASTDKTFDVVEQMPAFPGGQSALMSYLSNTVKYPKQAQEKGVQGRVIVQFVVEKNGMVSEAKVVKSVSPELDREALRVVEQMPKWQPGRQNGEAVRVKYNIPVSFRLQ